jgi:cell division protein FtsQ
MRKNHYKRQGKKRREVLYRQIRLTTLGVASLLFLATLSILSMFTHDFFTQWAYFNAKEIKVDGIERVPRAELLVQGHLRFDKNILSINLPLVRKRLLAHPWIAEARVRRQFPDTIIVSVREHQSLAVLEMGERFLINTEGEIFKKFTPDDPQKLPLVSGLAYADLPVGGQTNSRAFQAVQTVLALGRSPDSPLPNSQLKHVAVDTDMGLSLLAFDRNLVIRLGYGDYPLKYRRLAQVINYTTQNETVTGIEWIDLNDTERIVVNPMPTEPADKSKEA